MLPRLLKPKTNFLASSTFNNDPLCRSFSASQQTSQVPVYLMTQRHVEKAIQNVDSRDDHPKDLGLLCPRDSKRLQETKAATLNIYDRSQANRD